MVVLSVNFCYFIVIGSETGFVVSGKKFPRIFLIFVLAHRSIFLVTLVGIEIGRKSTIPAWIFVNAVNYYFYNTIPYTHNKCYTSEMIDGYPKLPLINLLILLYIDLMLSSVINSLLVALLVYHNETTLENSAKSTFLTNEKLVKALNAKTQLLARCSHELRTPLNGILGNNKKLFLEISK